MNIMEIRQKNEAAGEQYRAMLSEMVSDQMSEAFPAEAANKYYYFLIREIGARWIADEKPLWDIMKDMFVGLYGIRIPYACILKSDGNRVSLYVGSVADRVETLLEMLRGTLPQIEFEKTDEEDPKHRGDRLRSFAEINQGSGCSYGGVIKGDPVGDETSFISYQIDSVIKGMRGKPWILSLFALPVEKGETFARQQLWMTQAVSGGVLQDVTYSETDSVVTTAYKQTYYHSEQLRKKVEWFCNRSLESISSGEWIVTVNFASDTGDSAHLLGGLLTSAFYGDESEPEPVHAIYNMQPMTSPLVDGTWYLQTAYCGLQYPRYSSYLSSRELAIYAAFPTVDTGGLTIKEHVEFDVNRKDEGDLVIGRILDAGKETESPYRINSNEFNRHCLVVGLTGSGKTNTLKSLICGMTEGRHVPFMVIEPAKKEYWELYKLGYSDLQVYSVGSNEKNAHRFCVNPFERAAFTDGNGQVKTVPIQTHIDFVFAAFKASFIMYTPMPYVLERAIYEIYEDCGWDIHNNFNSNGNDIYPTIEDLYYKIPEVVEDMGYHEKMRKDLIGSLQARISSMRIGSKGDTLNVFRSFPMDRLLNGNVVVELEDIGDDDVKAFIISLLLINLLEYRRQQEDRQQEVTHLMLIEEAHRLLKNVQGGTGENADPRGAAVDFFCNLLAELRSKGQGFIIADQIPSKLAPDLIKNTNLKIVHRTVAEEERRLVGGAMHMTEEQIDYLASLKQGVAAVYSEGDNRPKLVKPAYAGEHLKKSAQEDMTRDEVLAQVTPNCISSDGKEYEALTDKRSPICRACKRFCQLDPGDIIRSNGCESEFIRFARSMDPKITHTCKIMDLDSGMNNFIDAAASGIDKTDRRCAKNCLLNCLLIQWDLQIKDKALKKEIERVYIQECIRKER